MKQSMAVGSTIHEQGTHTMTVSQETTTKNDKTPGDVQYSEEQVRMEVAGADTK